ncbi:hypothetical protein [Mycolicibacterium arenosum]|uniref:Secreted protein n=1 Tax=Mycolicibacterium arenosum TaxID=2952157 RepID=A0ABT1MCK2_9MYCO|nr:hypothetical protein [Mycolicibacterium sp. CAU 1645]MCP9276107.1 hypothetical protein [Mycolicibacterium sp. CAU 1645]
MPFVRCLLSAVVVAGAALATSPSAAAIPGYLECPPRDDLGLDIAGGLTCEEAETVAGDYDPEGDKYQAVDDFTCYGAAADVYPIVFTCVRGDQEIVVSDVASS